MAELSELQRLWLACEEQEMAKKLAENHELIRAFKQFASSRGVELSESSFSAIRPIGIVATYPNIALLLNEGMVPDKEGLLSLVGLSERFELRPFVHGYVFAPEHMLMLHPFFRRGLSPITNYQPDLVRTIWSSLKHCPLIALDLDRVRVDVSDTTFLEEEVWFGPRFNRDISSIEDGTVRLRPPMDIKEEMVDHFFGHTYALDIRWRTEGAIRIFEAEEFKKDSVHIEHEEDFLLPVKYIHAEFDTSKNHFRHFDGAVHLYSVDDYYARRDTDLEHNAKHTQLKARSVKLFKYDSPMDVATWLEHVGHFLTQDPLVHEYFAGSYPVRIGEILDALRKAGDRGVFD